MAAFLHSGKIQQFFIYLRSSLWFIPALMTFASIILAIGALEIDRYYGKALRSWWPRLFETESEGGRAMLATIAGSMATVAGVVFSITVVALALASTQYTSRALRNYMRDRTTQTVLGVFVGVYIYCLLVLRTISGIQIDFKPAASVLIAVILAIVAMGFFIYFIHHISSSIQASEIANSITLETAKSIDHLFPDKIGKQEIRTDAYELPELMEWHPVPSLSLGYLQAVKSDVLLEYANRNEVILRMEAGIGDFVTPGKPLLSVAFAARGKTDITAEMNRMYAVGTYRTIEQDAAFGIRQLVDIALKALSPGINDTTTAVICIEHLTYLLSLCAQRHMPGPYRFVKHELRVIARVPTFKDFVSLSFNQILENASRNSTIVGRMLDALIAIGKAAQLESHIVTLSEQLARIEDTVIREGTPNLAANAIQHHKEILNQMLLEKRLSPAPSYQVLYPNEPTN